MSQKEQRRAQFKMVKHTLRLSAIDGQGLPLWKYQPILSEYIRRMHREGWLLVDSDQHVQEYFFEREQKDNS